MATELWEVHRITSAATFQPHPNDVTPLHGFIVFTAPTTIQVQDGGGTVRFNMPVTAGVYMDIDVAFLGLQVITTGTGDVAVFYR